jgi:hypothetical protein
MGTSEHDTFRQIAVSQRLPVANLPDPFHLSSELRFTTRVRAGMPSLVVKRRALSAHHRRQAATKLCTLGIFDDDSVLQCYERIVCEGGHTIMRFLVGTTFSALVALLSACSSSASPTPTPNAPQSNVLMNFGNVGGSYTATFQGQTYSESPGVFRFSLNPGTYTITGTIRGGLFSVGFCGNLQSQPGATGVQAGTVRSLSGPSPTVERCG